MLVCRRVSTPLLVFVAVVFTLLCLSPLTDASKPKILNVVVDTKWNQTSILSETAEFMAAKSQAEFWQFVDACASGDESLDFSSDAATYETAKKISAQILEKPSLSALEFALRLHSYSPKVEMLRTIRENDLIRAQSLDSLSDETLFESLSSCPALVHNSRSLRCEYVLSESDIEASVSFDPVVYEFDHVLGAAADSVPLVVVYGDLTSPAFHAKHQRLAPLARDGKIQYVLRLFTADSSTDFQRAAGFGVELAIKNMGM